MMRQHFDSGWFPTILGKLCLYKSAGRDDQVYTFFVSSEPVMNICFSGERHRCCSASHIASFANNVEEASSFTPLARPICGTHVVTRAEQLEVVDVIKHRNALGFKFPQNRRRKVVIDVSNMRNIGAEIRNHLA